MDEFKNQVNGELTFKDLAKVIYSLKKAYPEIPYLLYRNGVGTFPKRNLHAFTGKPKSGKTLSASIFIAALLGDTSFGFESKMSDDEKVLFIDTEQDESNVGKMVQRIHKMLGWDINDDNDRFVVGLLKTISTDKRIKYIRKLIEFVKPAAVFIDGIADLVYDINDFRESYDIVESLSQLSFEFNCAICCTLHTNGNERNGKMRGHLGTIFTLKLTDEYLCSNTGSTFETSERISRNEKIGKIPYFIKTANDLVMPVLHESYQTEMDREKKEKKDSEKNENVYKIATEICKPGVKYQYGELRGIYMQHTHKSSSSFDRFRDKCVACNFLNRFECEGNTVFYELIEQSKDADEDINEST